MVDLVLVVRLDLVLEQFVALTDEQFYCLPLLGQLADG